MGHGRAVRDLGVDVALRQEDAIDRLAAREGITVVSATLLRYGPTDTIVRVRWTNGDASEIHDLGFCWAGASWLRRPGKDQRLNTVTVYQASNLTARCSGRTRVSRRLRRKRRATRRAAERDR
jgi:hypothetical protein